MLNVAAEKYQKRAIYIRKKFVEMTAKTKTKNAIEVEHASADSQYRVKWGKLQEMIKK